MRLCGVYYEAFHVQSYHAPCSHVLLVLFNIVITSLGRERADLYASRAFVCLSCMTYVLSFSLPHGVGDWLRLVIVAHPGLCV